MSMWTEIVNTALIGCERKPLSLNRPEDKLGELLAQLDQHDREGALLGAAAVVSLYERAGSLPLKDTQPLPGASEVDNTKRCSERAITHLGMMLLGEYQKLLPEWLAKLAWSGQRIPEELLPPLLELGRIREQFRESILPVLGVRGHWLMAQNPVWDYAIAGIDEKLWETGSRNERRIFFEGMRKRDAARARELLKSTWAQESPEDRISFLEEFENGLSLDDEAFLESALDDRLKAVRSRAADLLARLPESALCRRMLDRVRPLLTFKLNRLKRKTIEVSLPEVCDKGMKRDGIDLKHKPQDIGEKAWWLVEMLNRIPPRVWSEESGWTINDLITVAIRSEWKRELLGGWSLAAGLYRDVEWAEALLAEPIESDQAAAGLFYILPKPRQESFLIEFLKTNISLHENDPARIFLRICGHPWSMNLSRTVVDCLLHHAATDEYFKYDMLWYGIIEDFGCRLDPQLIPETVSRLTEASRPPAERVPLIEQFLSFIQFRYEMLKEINQ
jgi:hypothetical protein